MKNTLMLTILTALFFLTISFSLAQTYEVLNSTGNETGEIENDSDTVDSEANVTYSMGDENNNDTNATDNYSDPSSDPFYYADIYGNTFAIVTNGDSNVVIDGVSMSTNISVQENAAVTLSDGSSSQIEVSPRTALQLTASELNTESCYATCEIELHEVEADGEQKAAYHVTTQKEYKFFGIFKRNAQVSVDVDTETGSVISTDKPWWTMFSMESKGNVSTESNENAGY